MILFVKEMIQVLRDKRMRITLIVPPILQLIIFGYAANLDVRHIRTAVRDLDQTVDSRELLSDDLEVPNILISSSFPRHPEKSKISSGRGT